MAVGLPRRLFDVDEYHRMAEVGIPNSGEILRLIHERVMLDAIARGNVPQPAVSPDDAEAAND